MQLKIDDQLLRIYFFYIGVLILKSFCLAYATGISRIFLKVAATSEDIKWLGGTTKSDDRIERIRRAHLNDLENIPFFIIASFIYLLTEPDVTCALYMFRLYTFTRITHSISYVWLCSSIGRILSYEISNIIALYIVLRSIWYFM